MDNSCIKNIVSILYVIFENYVYEKFPFLKYYIFDINYRN